MKTNSLEYAQMMDKKDPLDKFRNDFILPHNNGVPIIYFCGNSLGLQTKGIKDQIMCELDKWGEFGVEGHFKPEDPWITYHENLKENMAEIVGAKPFEVAIMNTLSVNIHLMLVSFYMPTKERFKIICEHGAFPSDLYAMMSQAKFRGYDPEDVIIELKPRKGEATLRTEDILSTIHSHKDDLALILMGGVNYYTGQVFDLKEITRAGHEAGAIVGFDLAHAAGNVTLELHDWNVDFAIWCTYKYLNSGPGGIAASFVHEKHANRSDLQRFTGWWGNEVSTRFLMNREFSPAFGADGWQLSTSPIMLMAPLKTSLEKFKEAGFDNLVAKRKLLTGYLKEIICDIQNRYADFISIRIVTPEKDTERGAQLSIIVGNEGKAFFMKLVEKGVLGDWREPEVIRLTPVPLYNSFEEIYKFGVIFESLLKETLGSENKNLQIEVKNLKA
ncbi:MAG: kynureninase [Bacteroidota bacterium]